MKPIMNGVAVSIIVPVYNAENYLKQCLDSLISQSLPNIEIILINDGSTDTSGAICDEYKTLDSRVIVIHQDNSGQTVARNAGLAVATGSYIHFVDSDDWLDQDMESTMYKSAVKNNADIVTCDTIFHKGTKEIIARQPFEAGVYTKSGLIETVYPHLLYSGRFFYFGIYAAMWNKLFRRELVLKHIKDVDPAVRIGEDGLTTFASFLDAKKVVILKETLYHYRDDNSTSLTRSYREDQFDSALLLIKYLRDIAKRHKTTFDINPQIDIYLAYNVRSIILEEFYYKIDKPFKERYHYLQRIAKDPIVQRACARIDTSNGFTSEQARFLRVLVSGDTRKLLLVTLHRSIDQRLRQQLRTRMYANQRILKAYEKLKRLSRR